jgi:exodeoxyribonuclease V alpha subunit
MKETDLRELMKSEAISALDLHFGLLMERLAGCACPELARISALVSATTREGHIYLDLSDLPFPVPGPGAVLKELWNTGVVGQPGDFKPLVADGRGRVYLYRYWQYEQSLAVWIDGLTREKPEVPKMSSLSGRLARLFPGRGKEQVDWQLIAAFVTMMKKFVVISGGPGTGKTTTAAKILALLMEEAWPAVLRIGLASPTGKGAARLQSAMNLSKGSLGCSDQIRDALPADASTIHRLLGPMEASPYFRHNAENRLALDVLLVDEASMVDLALMSKLVQALPPECRLILLGDKDQLASVEAGAVLGDICNTGRDHAYSKTFCRSIGICPGAGGETCPAHCRLHRPSQEKLSFRVRELHCRIECGCEQGRLAYRERTSEGEIMRGYHLERSAASEVAWKKFERKRAGGV